MFISNGGNQKQQAELYWISTLSVGQRVERSNHSSMLGVYVGQIQGEDNH